MNSYVLTIEFAIEADTPEEAFKAFEDDKWDDHFLVDWRVI